MTFLGAPEGHSLVLRGFALLGHACGMRSEPHERQDGGGNQRNCQVLASQAQKHGIEEVPWLVGAQVPSAL
jgi:hypothetical protein